VKHIEHSHALPVDQALRAMATEASSGLAVAEVEKRRAQFGRNEVTAKAGKPAWLKFLLQFNQSVV
jgi:cation-transporting ATPase F